MVKVSVIVPMFNVSKYIKTCIESVQNQDFKDWELILVDDCSSDSTIPIAKKCAEDDERIKIIHNKINQGPMKAREQGYKSSKGDYLFFLDGDDILPTNSLTELFNIAITQRADIVCGKIISFDEKNNQKEFWPSTLNGKIERANLCEELLKGLFPHNLAGKLFRSALLMNNEILSYPGLRRGEDGFLFFQLLKNSTIIYVIDEVVYLYRKVTTSSTHRRRNRDDIMGAALFNKYKYNFFTEELGNVDVVFFRKLYKELSSAAIDFSYKDIVHVYNAVNFKIDFSYCNLLKYYSVLEIIKIYFKISVLGYIKGVKYIIKHI